MSDGTSEERHGLGVLDWFENSFPTRLLKFLAPYALVLAAVPFFTDLDYKSSEREAQAWQIVTTHATGNSGKIAALEYLNSDHPLALPNPRLWGVPFGPVKATGVEGIPKRWVLLANYGPWKERTPLIGIDLAQKKDPATDMWIGAPTYLESVDLRDAELARADFTAAQMDGANLSGARMYSVIFVNARLEDASFAGARLTRADFTNARLVNTDFTGARLKETVFTGADLRGAKLTGTEELTQAQLADACTDATTTLPPGLHASEACEVSERNYLVRGLNGLPNRMAAPNALDGKGLKTK